MQTHVFDGLIVLGGCVAWAVLIYYVTVWMYGTPTQIAAKPEPRETVRRSAVYEFKRQSALSETQARRIHDAVKRAAVRRDGLHD